MRHQDFFCCVRANSRCFDMVDLSPNDVLYFSDDFPMRRIRKLVEYDSSIEERYIPLKLLLLGETIEEFNVNGLRFNQFSSCVRESAVSIEFIAGGVEHFDKLVLW